MSKEISSKRLTDYEFWAIVRNRAKNIKNTDNIYDEDTAVENLLTFINSTMTRNSKIEKLR